MANAIKHFWKDVLWGRLDYLLVDLPPGASDATLTAMQSLPLTGAVLVTIPRHRPDPGAGSGRHGGGVD